MADGLAFLRCCVPHNICDEFLLFVGGNTTAIVPRKNKFYPFDSHSRGGRGFCVSDGTSVLLRFHNLSEVERFIQVAYLEFRDIQRLYFQLQFVKIDITSSMKSAIKLNYKRIRKNHQKKNKIASSNSRETQIYFNIGYAKSKYSKIFGTPEHDKRKEQMKVAARKRRKLFEVEQGGGIALFKREIFEGSFYICDVCNRGLYKRSVIHLSLENYNISHEIFRSLLSYDGRAYICITYHKKLLKVLASC